MHELRIYTFIYTLFIHRFISWLSIGSKNCFYYSHHHWNVCWEEISYCFSRARRSKGAWLFVTFERNMDTFCAYVYFLPLHTLILYDYVFTLYKYLGLDKSFRNLKLCVCVRNAEMRKSKFNLKSFTSFGRRIIIIVTPHT